MKRKNKILISIIAFLSILLSSCTVFAINITDYVDELQFSENYLKYLELSDEEKEGVYVPRMYDIPKTTTVVSNPLKLARLARSSADTSFSLKELIAENMVVKNQQDTGTCYAFSSLAALESTLALKDYNFGNTPVVYDFSERHMEYATSRTFLDGKINENGYNREVGDGGTLGVPTAYLTNGTGAIQESEMPFENNKNKIDISAIQNKEVVTQVNDTIDFPSYSATEDTSVIKQQMKNHIMNYGAIDAGVHGAQLFSDCYNIETGAIYCSDSSAYPVNHAVIIVGWDDNYEKENFLESNMPENDGAWIIRNSWGSEYRMTLEEMKQFVYDIAKSQNLEVDWTGPEDVPDDTAKGILEQLGFTIENNEAYVILGDNGFMYISYEDANIYSDLTGIIDAQNEVTYENIYQHDYYGSFLSAPFTTSKIYLATIFDKQTSGVEYLTQVAINASEIYTCKVYVNPNGTSKASTDLQQVQLKAGETETFDAGYHTIEFLNPIQITADNFVVVLEIEGTQTDSISTMMEFNFGEYFNQDTYSQSPLHFYDNVIVESGKCFWTAGDGMNTNEWIDSSQMYTLTNGNYPNFDTTIKAFTTSKILESIEVTTAPTKTRYLEGEDFDPTGMVVKATYENGMVKEVTDYTIQDGTDLQLGQTTVTIEYEGKTTTQAIEVVENAVESIAITTSPTKTEYYAGEDFDPTGMVVEATYTDGTIETVTDYTVENGQTLKKGQTTVTIAYEGKTTTQEITVNANPVVSIEIETAPTKTSYVVGQNFDKTGMVVKATYENGMVKEVTDYTIQDGTDLQLGQTTVTIEYEGKTVTQEITVIAKTVTAISVKTMPTKTQYIQNKEELDLTGGIIEISYNDNTTEELSMTSEEVTASGFDNKNLGTQTITLTYEGKTTQFEVEVKELPKPENSDFDNMQGSVTRARTYSFTDSSKNEYMIVNVEITDIITATENDEMKYYYYLSPNSNEENISNWVKIEDLENSGNQLSFEINTSDISNYEEIVNANDLYLYIKEVATRNDMTSEEVTTSLKLELEDINIEVYLDGEKVTEVDTDTEIDSESGEEPDNTLAPGEIPNAGKSILIICLAIIVLVIGRIAYLKYKDIEIK